MADERRTRNKRGEGERLRPVLIEAASDILGESGNEDSVTLRAIARRAGVTAPAIYAHFDGAKDVVLAVLNQTFAELADQLVAAADQATDAEDRLERTGSAYLEFAAERPHHYRIMFERHRGSEQMAPVIEPKTIDTVLGSRSFDVLVRGVREAMPDQADPVLAATRWWIALHGQATLQQNLPWFPWPSSDELARDLRRRLLA